MRWVYLSPHLDDAVLSCGGLLWEQARKNELVIVWTMCAGDPATESLSEFAQSLHQRWQTAQDAVVIRRNEDIRACSRLNAAWYHYQLPDCVYRVDPQNGRPLYRSEASLWGAISPAESNLIHQIANQLDAFLDKDDQLVAPMALGHHVDHQLAVNAAEHLNRELWYYADYPYILTGKIDLAQYKPIHFPVSEDGLSAWQDAVACYNSQISTFWENDTAMRKALHEYWEKETGINLFRKR